MAGDRIFNLNGANFTYNDIHDNQHCTIIVPQGEKTSITPKIPAELDTEEARALLEKMVAAGKLDANYQPCEDVTKIYSALIADAIGEKLGLEKRWSPFEELWSRKNMRNDYQRALETKAYDNHREEIKKILA